MGLHRWSWGRVSLVIVFYWAVMAAVALAATWMAERALERELALGADRELVRAGIAVSPWLLALVLGPPLLLAVVVAVARRRGDGA